MTVLANNYVASKMKTQKALTQDELQQLLKEFKHEKGEALKLRSLGYFGSYACGEARLDSDVDIVFGTDYPNLLTTKDITQSSDFISTPAGREHLDSICMVLLAVGESLKQVDKKTEGKLLSNYPNIP